MDANNTRFHLLLGKADWSRGGAFQEAPLSPGEYLPSEEECAPATLSPGERTVPLFWDEARDEVTLQPYIFKFEATAADVKPTIDGRRGAGRDGFGNWYWIAPSKQEILVNSAGSLKTSHFWGARDGSGRATSPEPGGFVPVPLETDPPFTELSGLAVTADHYLVAGTINPGGLLIFDLYGGGAPRRTVWRGAFAPFDLAPAPDGGLFILDRANRKLWGLDRDFSPLSFHLQRGEAAEKLFQPGGCAATRVVGAGPAPEGYPVAETANADPVAVEVLADGSTLVLELLEGGNCRVRRYSFTGGRTREVKLSGHSGSYHYSVSGQDIAFQAAEKVENEPWTGRLYVADSEGNQAVAFDLRYNDTLFEIEPVIDFYPMRLYGGKGVVVSGGAPYYDFSDRWIPLVKQSRPRYLGQGLLETECFDGREPDCVWHRLLLDGSIPPETQVTVWSRAGRTGEDVEAAEWQLEPLPYRRSDGAELPFLRQDGFSTYELLFQGARGRYLQLALRFTGNGRATPRLRALRIYYPRFSYLVQYLPAVYREAQAEAEPAPQEQHLPPPQSPPRQVNPAAPFLERYLANLEGIYTAIEDRIAAAQILFDPLLAPPEALDWLAGWLGVLLDPAWDERSRRLFIRHAMEFFRCRGTIRGLQMALRLALDAKVDERIFTDRSQGFGKLSPIRIVENFRARRTPGVLLGDPTAPQGPALITPQLRWTPKQKRDELNRRYREFLAQEGKSAAGDVQFPVRAPIDTADAELWRNFSRRDLGFVPAAGAKNLKRWQEFLARRYRTIAAVKNAYGALWSSFDEIPLPQALPDDGPPLFDWFQFEGVVLQMQEAAHRFTVVLPTPQLVTVDSEEYRRRLDLARRIVELEKPAHTKFSVRFYWAMFRVGEARIGYDTVVDQGSRGHGFMSAIILGRGHVGEGFIGSLNAATGGRYTVGESELGKTTAT